MCQIISSVCVVFIKAVIRTSQQITVIGWSRKSKCLFTNKFYLRWPLNYWLRGHLRLLRGTRKRPSPRLKLPAHYTRMYPHVLVGAPKKNPVSPLEWVRGLVTYKTPLFAMINIWGTAPQAGESWVPFAMVSLWISFRTHYDPRVDSSSNINGYKGYLLGCGKGGRCVALKHLRPSCDNCLEIIDELSNLFRPVMG